MSDPQPRPGLELPVAILKFWPDSSDGGRAFVQSVDRLPAIDGLDRLDDATLALRPTPGRGDVADIALRLADALQRQTLRQSRQTLDSLPGLLVFPGEIRIEGERVEVVPDALYEDLTQRQAKIEAGTVALTGYAASWLCGRYELADAGSFEGPSGRRVPLQRLEGESVRPRPWHNPSLFGRHPEISRQALDRTLVQAMAAPSVGLEGPLGVGKSHALWRALADRPALWIGLERGLTGLPQLRRALLRNLSRLAPEVVRSRDFSLGDLESLDTHDQATQLLRAIDAAGRGLGARPVLVLEDPSTARPEDRDLASALLQVHRQTAAAPRGASRLFLTGRRLASFAGTGGLQSVPVKPLAEDELAELSEALLAGLELPKEVKEGLHQASAGFPLALEEGLIAMVHHGRLRRVYGSFFYAGSGEDEYLASDRLVRHVEAAVGAVGEVLPLRMLAAAAHSVGATQLRSACADFGIELEAGWQRAFVDADWLRESAGRLDFVCPAYGLALRETLSAEGARALRHSLGSALAGGDDEWAAYRLMAGSPEALPSLLDSSRERADSAPREEIFEALLAEYREHRERRGDEATELQILWVLLPLGRRLGRLGKLQRELVRAVTLAEGDELRYIALVALKAEFDQEQGKFRDAESGLRQALSASQGSDEKKRATLFLRLGALLHRQQRWSEAREIFLSLASVADRSGPSALGATCRFYLGNLALQQRRLESAEAHQTQSLEYRLEHGLLKAAGASLCSLGAISQAKGDFPQALEHFQRGREILIEADASEWDLSYAMIGVGKAMISLGDVSGGLVRLKKALDRRRGRDDFVGEGITHLELARGRLLLGQNEAALEEARRAHFHLSLVPEGSFLGDAERLLGRIGLHTGELKEASSHLSKALALHRGHGDDHAIAEDLSWRLELAIQQVDVNSAETSALELERLLDSLPQPDGGERLFFRLYRGLTFLHEQGIRIGDPERPLRRAYKELMRKTAFLPPARRQAFLFQVLVHQEILNAATKNQISLPEVPMVSPGEA
ncbi:MAG: tetratricopeptide repeat protein [Acidobacteriota bacterium]